MSTLEYAIQMEMEGRRYYLEQAEKNKDDAALNKVLNLLADSEKEHEKLLRKRLNKEEYTLSKADNNLVKTVFNGLKDYEASEYRSTTQLDVYRLAVDIEEKSIDHYQEMLKEAEDEKDKELFEFLLTEEKQHLLLFEELVKMLTRPEEWVESAEFGVREDY